MDTNEHDEHDPTSTRHTTRADPEATAPPAAPKRLPPVVLAVDIGGTKFAAGLVTPRGELLDRAVVLVDQNVGPEAHFKALAGIVEQQLGRGRAPRRARRRASGSASAGPITRHCETVSPVNIPAWRDFPLRDRLAELTGTASTASSTARRWRSPRAGRARPRASRATAC